MIEGQRSPKRTHPSGARPWAACLLAIVHASCFGDHALPDTTPPGSADSARITLTPAASARAGKPVPIQIAAVFAPGAAPPDQVCVALTTAPGKLTFPFASPCPTDRDGGGNSAVDIDAGGTPDGATAGADGATIDAPPGVDAGVMSKATPAPSGGADGAGLTRAFGCAGVQRSAGRATASVLAAYLPAAMESSATLFGALYANAACTGPPVAEIGLTLTFPTSTATTGAGGAPAGDAGPGDDAQPADGTQPGDAAETTDTESARDTGTADGSPEGRP